MSERSTFSYTAVHEDGVPDRLNNVSGLVKGDFEVPQVFPKGERLDHGNISPVVGPHHVRVDSFWDLGRRRAACE